MKFSVVIPAWRGEEQLRENIPAVLETGVDEVIVVDASPDDDGNFVRENFSTVKVIDFKHNPGFGSNVNRGVEEADGEILILMNQDVKPDKNILKYLREDFKDEKLFGVSFAEQQFGPTEGSFEDGYVVHNSVQEYSGNKVKTFWASGGSSAIRKKYWDELNGFDPIFDPAYWEDIDLSYRAQKRGWKIIWDKRVKVFHEREQSYGGKHYDQLKKQRNQERNHLLFNWKNLSDEGLKKQFVRSAFLRMMKHPGYLRIILMAISQEIRVDNSKWTVKQNDALVSDRDILRM